MDNQYKKAGQVLDKLYSEMPQDSFMKDSVVNERFNRFQKMFSAEKLSSIRGYDIWAKLFDLSGENSLLYMLSSRTSGYRDFGSISGGGVDFYPIYYAKDGAWSTKGSDGKNKRITYDQAMEKGEKYKNKLVNALRLIERTRFETIESYESFEKSLREILGKDAERVWIHKYFHMMYPHLFSEFHSRDWKIHFLCAMQIKPRDTFYGMAGQIAEIRRHMNLQDYYRIANVVYHYFPEIGDGGICRLVLTANGIKTSGSWKPGEMELMAPSDFDNLLVLKWFRNASEKDRNNMFIVMDDKDSLYGVFSRLEGEPSRGQPFKTGRRGLWHHCFHENEWLPIPEDGKNTKDRTFKKPENLIFIYKHYYPYFDVDSELETIFENNKEQFENEYSQLNATRKNCMDKYPIVYKRLLELKREEIIYGYAGSFLSVLYDDLSNLDMVRGPALQDIGYMFRNGEGNWYDQKHFSNEAEAFEYLKKEIIFFLCVSAGSDSAILESPLSRSLKIKLLSVYFPEKYIGISDTEELDFILEMLGVTFKKDEDWLKKNRLLMNWKKSHLPFANRNISNYVFLKTVCAWLEIPFSHSSSLKDPVKSSKDDDGANLSGEEGKHSESQKAEHNPAGRQASSIDSDTASRKGQKETQGTSEKASEDTYVEAGILPAADPDFVRENEIEESIEQLNIADEAVAVDDNFTYAGTPQDKKEFEETPSRKVIPRDIQKKRNALAHAKYKCEYDKNHQTFISRATGFPYMEAHHLIPMEYYDSFNVSIDIEENIVSLCSNCHREIHHGRDAVRIVKKLYNNRKQYLQAAGIDISLEQMLIWYGCTSESEA